MNRTRTVATAAAGLLVLSTAVVVASSASASNGGQGGSIVGAWRMTIDPRPNPAGDPPPFASRIAFAKGGVVTEAVSSVPPGYTSASNGVGAWTQSGSVATFTFEKFLFNGGTFAAIQRVRGTATVSGDGSTQAGPATATILATDGTTVLRSFVVDASGTRMTP